MNNGRRIRFSVLAALILTQVVVFAAAQGKTLTPADDTSYRNFDVAIYCSIQDMCRMIADPHRIEESWGVIHRSMKVDKVWLETFRGNEQTSDADVRKLKDFFAGRMLKHQAE